MTASWEEALFDPRRFDVERVEGEARPVIPPESLRSGEAIERTGNLPLRRLVRPGIKVVIAFTDATRACPDRHLVGFLLDELFRGGVERDDVLLLAAVGLHRPMTGEERLRKLGPEILRQVRVTDHNASDPSGLADLGTIGDLPVVVSRAAVEADLLLATGVVEPHQYAGYSGGAKTVAIGCGGEAVIRATHGPEMIDRPGTELGRVRGNPFQEFVRGAGRRAGLRYVVNVMLNAGGQAVAAAAGPPDAVHDHLTAAASGFCEVTVQRPAHLAVAGVPAAKGVNLYQASRAFTYTVLAAGTPLLPGAPVLLPAEIPEGAGEGVGERRFFDLLSGAGSPAALVEELRRTGFPGGAQRAYVLAKALLRNPVIVVGAQHPEIVEACRMIAVPDMAEGLRRAGEMARRRFGLPTAPLNLLVVRNALHTIPRLGEV